MKYRRSKTLVDGIGFNTIMTYFGQIPISTHHDSLVIIVFSIETALVKRILGVDTMSSTTRSDNRRRQRQHQHFEVTHGLINVYLLVRLLFYILDPGHRRAITSSELHEFGINVTSSCTTGSGA
jgi:hypothetical protein